MMKLTDLFKAFKSGTTEGGNYRYIAENVATIYYIIQNSEFGKKLTEKQLLAGTALIDLMPYIQNQTIRAVELSDALLQADVGEVSISFFSKRHSDMFEQYPNKKLVNLVMQLEAMIFRADSNMSNQVIVDAVIGNKSVIQNAIEKVLLEGKEGKCYSTILSRVTDYINDEGFQQAVLAYKN